MKLFCIKDLVSGRIIPNLFFATKQSAKAKRNELGSTTHCVTYGPDHHRYRG